MTPISDVVFAVIDVETTGSYPNIDRITDIAYILVKNNEIIKTYQSLINPHKKIPSFIQQMTGITNKMTDNAPEADEVMLEIYNTLSKHNTYFVAHNSNFDWRFIYETIKREHSIKIDTPRICTLKIARKIIPQPIKKNVGALSEYFNIPMLNRHRAFDDALATAHFFIEMLSILTNRYNLKYVEEIETFQNSKINYRKKYKLKNKDIEKINSYSNILPKTSGIIKFINEQKKVIYIEKTQNIQNFFLNIEETECFSQKIFDIIREFHHIEWISTNSRLETNLIFHKESKQHLPKYNHIEASSHSNNEVDKDLQLYSLVALMRSEQNNNAIEVYFIKQSELKHIEIIEEKTDLSQIYLQIKKVFYQNINTEEADKTEHKIVNNWLDRYSAVGRFIEFNNEDFDEFVNLVSKSILNFI